jgi:hypothetical protein
MKFLNHLLIICFTLLVFSLSFTVSRDFNQDLGRHLKLGELILKTGQVPTTNLFSYTNPDFPFINHHWLAEVIFYSLFSLFGPSSLTIAKTLLIIFSFFILIQAAAKKADSLIPVAAAFLFLPLFLQRLDIRPEIFGFFLFSCLLYILFEFNNNNKLVYFIPLIMLLWVNLHISFVFGVFLVLLIGIKHARFDKNLLIISLGILVLVLNPNGPSGLLYPLSIFKNYGYTIVENQNLFYLSQTTFNPLIKYFIFISPLIIIALIVLFVKKSYQGLIILLTFFLLSIIQIRHMPFLALAAIPLVSLAIKALAEKVKMNNTNIVVGTLMAAVMIILSLAFIENTYYLTFDTDKSFGLGFIENAEKGVDFLEKNHLPKNVFNNFDIGGYLIYRLYPEYRFFVDNRPEAYPDNFLQDVYVRMQTDHVLRNKIFDRYNIKTVFFTHTDQTQWAKIFISVIYEEPEWKLVHLDPSVVILAKETNLPDLKNNQRLMEKMIETEGNYYNLLTLAGFFQNVKKDDLAVKAFLKAKKLNPQSCSVKRMVYSQYQNTPYYYLSDQIKKNSWYCF